MDLDMHKRLLDCTLGEYLAAERVVGVTTAWAIALFSVTLAWLGRAVYRKLKKTPVKSIEALSSFTIAPPLCAAYKPATSEFELGHSCTLPKYHGGTFHAQLENGKEVALWGVA